MLYLLLKVSTCLSQFVLRSPDALFNNNYSYTAANFGTPALYQIYGKLNFVKQTNCNISSINPNDFVLIDSISYCSYENLALSAQNQGAKLIAFALDSLVQIYPNDKIKASEVNIVCIGLLESTFDLLRKYSFTTIWATFKYELKIRSKVEFELVLSGNYTLDYNHLKPILSFHPMSESSNDFFSLTLSYLTPDNELITNEDKDCYVNREKKKLCMVSEAGVSGKKKYFNSRLICKFYYLFHNIDNFFYSVKNLYENCENDYSDDCFQRYIPLKNEFVTSYYIRNTYSLAPYYYINDIYFFWPYYYIEGSLLSDSTSETDYLNCEEDCKNSMLPNDICDLSCNTSSCGYDNLLCLFTENCLNFLIGDGSCNSDCISDTDCNEDYCSTDCLFSDMSSNLCPRACTEECFKNCNQDIYCSSGCKFESMEQDECPVACSYDCFEQNCNKKLFCSPGCKYSDWELGIVSEECTSSCRAKYYNGCYLICDFDYNCTETCNEDCCEKEKSNKNSSEEKSKINVVALIVSVVTISSLIIIVIIIVVILYRKKRNNFNGPIENQFRAPAIKNQNLGFEKKFNFNPDLFPTKFNHSLAFIGDAICTIDISGFRIGDPVIITPCMHIFHPGCINEWLNSIQREKRCPNCNYEMSNIKIHLE